MSKEVIFLHESVGASFVKDVVSVGMLIGAVGVGIYLDSTVLQFVAAVMWLLVIFANGFREMKNHTFSIEELRARLDEVEAEK
jgi:predicted MFS family arabinose efflux permease